jgi:hypothetical protein
MKVVRSVMQVTFESPTVCMKPASQGQRRLIVIVDRIGCYLHTYLVLVTVTTNFIVSWSVDRHVHAPREILLQVERVQYKLGATPNNIAAASTA